MRNNAHFLKNIAQAISIKLYLKSFCNIQNDTQTKILKVNFIYEMIRENFNFEMFRYLEII